MKRRILNSLLLSFFTISVLCFSFPVSAAGRYVYTEDFEDGEAGSFLLAEQQQGTMEIVSDSGNKICKLVTHTGEDENGYFHYIFGPTVGEYFTYSMRFRPDNIKNPDYNCAYIWFRCQKDINENGFDEGENEAYGFSIWEWRAAFVAKSYSNFRGSTEPKTRTDNQDFIFENGTWYDLRIEARGMNFRLYVDDQLALEWTETEYIWFTEGNFAFTAWGVNISVDDIVIAEFDDEASLDSGVIESSNTSSSADSSSISSSVVSKTSAAESSEVTETSSAESAGSNADESENVSDEQSSTADSYDDSGSQTDPAEESGSQLSSNQEASGLQSETSDESDGVKPWVIIVIVTAVILAGAAALLINQKKKKNNSV